MSLDVAKLRAETAGCEGRIFFNNAGASLQPRAVVDRVVEHLRLEEAVGGYEAADRVGPEVEAVYGAVASLLGAAPEEIALTESATRAWDAAFYGLPWQAGDRILTTENDYGSNYVAYLQLRGRTGVVVEVVPTLPDGAIDLAALRAALGRDDRVRLIALTHVPTNNGRVQPAAAVGRLAREFGVPYLLDACQSAGQLPLNVGELGCDMLSATGRKYLRGPRGTGFLYVRTGFLDQLDPLTLDIRAAEWTGPESYRMRDDARRFELWESSLAGRLGLGVAVRSALELGLAQIAVRVQAVAAQLREELSKLPEITVQDHGWRDAGEAAECGIVTFTHARLPAAEVAARLAEQKMVVRENGRSGALLDMSRRGLEAVVRASVHCYNTEDEVERFCAEVGRL